MGTYAVIAAGGTGGHVVPGLAVARALVARGHAPDEIHFVSSASVPSGPTIRPVFFCALARAAARASSDHQRDQGSA